MEKKFNKIISICVSILVLSLSLTFLVTPKKDFSENENRVLAFNKWLEQREAWKQRQIETKMLRDLFANFYNLYLKYHKNNPK